MKFAPGERAPRSVYRPLSRLYALWMCGVALTLVMTSGAIEMYFSYRESLDHIGQVQEAQAVSAAREIASYIGVIETGLLQVAKMPWNQSGFGPPQRREEFYRLMQLVPAITDLQSVSKQGLEQLYVSRLADDRSLSNKPLEEPALLQAAAGGVRHGGTFFRDGYLPAVRMSTFDGTGVMVATVDLRLLGQVVTRLEAGEGGMAYIVDEQGHLIAHTRTTQAVGRINLAATEAVRQAQRAGNATPVLISGLSTTDTDGRRVIVTAASIPGTRWIVFMEQQRAAALKPAWATLSRTLLLMVIGVLVAIVAGIVFAKRMAAPIITLRQATARIADGELQAPFESARHDEIGDLAQDFNQMASRLRDLYASLEAKVAERTAQLSEARDVLAARADELSQLKDEAERANAAKTRFLAAASHDLRQPMHSISLLLGVLQSRLDSPEHLALADKIQSSVATMESLFGNLLDISKLDAGAMQAHVEDVDLGWLLHRLEQTWAPQAAEKGLRLRVRACNLVVRGDAALLERIAGNLVANAIRYTRRGGVLVGCRLRGAHVELQVWDSGPGIEPRYREAIFEEFFRIEAPGSGQEKGLGLGLSIVQRCAQLLGYSLIVSSRVGHGTVFRLVMPLGTSAAPRARTSPCLATSQQALAGRFVVVIDDEGMNAQALVDALHACQAHVVAAAGCDEALAELQQHLRVPDLIVTDYRLGGGRDGFEVISRLRQHYDEEIPALMVTANTDADLPARAAELRAALLHKPIGLQRLFEAMQASLAAAP